MHSPCKPPTTTHTFLFGVLSTITAPLVALRVLVAMGVITITSQTVNAVTSIATVLAMAGAFSVGWRRSILLSRAERAHLDQRLDWLEQRVETTEKSVHRLPRRAHQPYRPIAVGSEGDPVPLPTGLDPDTAAALRRINRRLLKANNSE